MTVARRPGHTAAMKPPRIGIMGGIAAIAVGIGIAAAGIGHLLRSIPSAQAAEGIGPTVTGGVHPWVNLAGMTVGNDTVAYTVPPDRIFVMTGGCVWNNQAILQQDADVKMHYLTRFAACDDTSSSHDNVSSLLRAGNAHLVFEPGSQVIIHLAAPSAARYYFEGYLAQP